MTEQELVHGLFSIGIITAVVPVLVGIGVVSFWIRDGIVNWLGLSLDHELETILFWTIFASIISVLCFIGALLVSMGVVG